MKKIIFKCCIFTLILIIFLMNLSKILIPKSNDAENGMHYVKANAVVAEEKNSLDVIVVGDSESFATIIPMKLWEDYGYTTYVSGTPAQVLTETLSQTYKIFKSQSPKILILEANNVFKNIELDSPIEEVLKYLLPVVDYHSRWKHLKKDDFTIDPDYTWKDEMKGYDYSLVIDKADSSKYMEYTDEVEEIKPFNKLCLKILNKFCKNNGTELMVISTPSTVNWNYKKHNGIEKFLKEENIDFLDLNILAGEIGIDWEKDTRDKGDHLNHTGAIKATDYIGKYLSKKNILENHKDDEKYSKWNELLEKYKQREQQKEEKI